MQEYLLFASMLVALATSWLVTKWIIPKALERNFTGRDVHKKERKFVSELGGVGIAIGFVMGALVYVGLSNFFGGAGNWVGMLAATTSVLIVFIIGLMDDLFEIPWGNKALLPIIGAIPLAVLALGNPVMNLPFIGVIDFGLLYYLVLMPLGMTGAANAMNMIGGYNGSEAGLGLLIMVTLAVIAAVSGAGIALAILLVMIGALIGFLYFNWFPAKIFMGDAGTLQMGAVIAVAAVLGGMEKYAVLLFALYFVNLVVFLWGIVKKAKLVKFAHPNEEGVLVAPDSFWRHYLPFIIIRFTHPTEQKLVGYLFGLQALIGFGVLLLYFGGF